MSRELSYTVVDARREGIGVKDLAQTHPPAQHIVDQSAEVRVVTPLLEHTQRVPELT